MFDVKFDKIGKVDEKEFTRVVIVSRYKNKWVFCKHRERNTWEMPGGHIEKGEDWLTAAKRELFEETGALKAKIEPICVYSISKYGLLCFAEIVELGALPESEIEKIEFFDDLPENLTYKGTHDKMFEKVRTVKGL